MPGRAVITRRGKGSDLVMVHGWAMHSRVWGTFADQLAEHFTLHLVDLPGHGAAAGAGHWRLEEVLTQLLAELPPAPWLGWSMGGIVALSAATSMPARVRSLVLVGVNPRFVAGDGWPDAMPAEDFGQFEASFRNDPVATLQRFLALAVGGAPGARRAGAELRGGVSAFPMAESTSLLDGLRLLREADLTGRLPAVEQPALWIAGAHDRITPPACSARAAALMPRSEHLCIGDAAHVPFLSHPERVTMAVREFLATEAAA